MHMRHVLTLIRGRNRAKQDRLCRLMTTHAILRLVIVLRQTEIRLCLTVALLVSQLGFLASKIDFIGMRLPPSSLHLLRVQNYQDVFWQFF